MHVLCILNVSFRNKIKTTHCRRANFYEVKHTYERVYMSLRIIQSIHLHLFGFSMLVRHNVIHHLYGYMLII